MTKPAPSVNRLYYGDMRPNLIYEYEGYPPPAKGWAVSIERMREMHADNRLYFPKNMTHRIQRKRYLDELEGETVDSLWDDISPINSQAAERLHYPTHPTRGTWCLIRSAGAVRRSMRRNGSAVSGKASTSPTWRST